MGYSAQEWLHLLQGFATDPVSLLVGLALLSLIADSAAVIVAGLLVAQGVLPAPLTALVLVIALLVGDCAIYLFGYLARESIWLERQVEKAGALSLEAWVRPRQTQLLALARILPGSRSVIFLAFGYFRLSLERFVTVNLVAGSVWALSLLVIVSTSAGLFAAIGTWASALAGIAAAAVVMLPAYMLAKRSRHAPPRTP